MAFLPPSILILLHPLPLILILILLDKVTLPSPGWLGTFYENQANLHSYRLCFSSPRIKGISHHTTVWSIGLPVQYIPLIKLCNEFYTLKLNPSCLCDPSS